VTPRCLRRCWRRRRRPTSMTMERRARAEPTWEVYDSPAAVRAMPHVAATTSARVFHRNFSHPTATHAHGDEDGGDAVHHGEEGGGEILERLFPGIELRGVTHGEGKAVAQGLGDAESRAVALLLNVGDDRESHRAAQRVVQRQEGELTVEAAKEQQIVEQTLRGGEETVQEEVEEDDAHGGVGLGRHAEPGTVATAPAESARREELAVAAGAAEAKRGRPRLHLTHHELLYRHPRSEATTSAARVVVSNPLRGAPVRFFHISEIAHHHHMSK